MLSRVEHRHRGLDFWPVASGNVGNLLEWYDFVVFAFLAPVIGARFCPSADALSGLINAFGVLAGRHALMRPVSWMMSRHRRCILSVTLTGWRRPASMAAMGVYDQIKKAFQDIVAPELHALRGEIRVLDQKIIALRSEVRPEDRRRGQPAHDQDRRARCPDRLIQGGAALRDPAGRQQDRFRRPRAAHRHRRARAVGRPRSASSRLTASRLSRSIAARSRRRRPTRSSSISNRGTRPRAPADAWPRPGSAGTRSARRSWGD